MNVSHVIEYVSDILNDQEVGFAYTTWDQPFLLGTLNDALSRIASALPWAVRQNVDVTLKPGAVQDLALDGFANPIVIGQVCHQLGVRVLMTPPLKVDVSTMRDACCPPSEGMFKKKSEFDANDTCGKYRLTQYAIDPDNPSSLVVSPPVPAGVSPVIVVSTSTFAALTIDMPFDRFLPVYSLVVDWMLHRAYSVDVKTEEIRQRAQQYFEQFHTSLKTVDDAHRRALEG